MPEPERPLRPLGGAQLTTPRRRSRSGLLRRSLALLGASHPGPVAAVTSAAIGLGASAGARRARLATLGAAVLAGQLSIGWQNDYLDARRDTEVARRDKPVARGKISRDEVGRAALLAGLACLPTSLGMGRRAGALHLGAVASATAYNLGLKATPASFLPYAVSFGLLPRVSELAADPAAPPRRWSSLAGACLGLAAHFVNVLPDREHDRSQGVLGLPQRLSAATDVTVAGAMLAASAGAIAVGTAAGGRTDRAVLGANLAAALGIAGLARRGGGRAPFRLVLLLALLDVAWLLRATATAAAAAGTG